MRGKQLLSILLVFLTLISGSAAFCDYNYPSSLTEFSARVNEHTIRLEETFSVPCSRSVMENLKENSSLNQEASVLSEILLYAGCSGSFSVAWYEDHVVLSDISYYAGWRILYAYKSGNTGLLNSRERQTLFEALELTAGAAGSDLEKERYLHDALCARITYDAAEDENGDKDCAIGALLNGRADCDGYADAMMLCCSLAGIPCRYIHGQSVDPPQDDTSDGSHLWNLVFVNGSWLMCDVTWGDQEGGPDYLYFNLGSRDASPSYRWNPDTLFTEIAPEADFSAQLMPDQRPVSVRSAEDVYSAVREAVLADARRLTLYCPGEVLWQAEPDPFSNLLGQCAVKQYQYRDSGRLYEISNIIPAEKPFSFCDSKEDILTAIRLYADKDIHSFSLYLLPVLADQLFTDDQAALQQVLSESCLENPGQYRYSAETGLVIFTDTYYTAPLAIYRSVEEVLAMIRRELPSQPSSLTFQLENGLRFDSILEQTATAVYSCGAASFSYSVNGSRITLSDLSYYENYCIAESEADVLSYMTSVKSTGKRDLRVYCPGELYNSLHADHAAGFFSLLEQAGFTEYSVGSNDTYHLLVAEGLK